MKHIYNRTTYPNVAADVPMNCARVPMAPLGPGPALMNTLMLFNCLTKSPTLVSEASRQ